VSERARSLLSINNIEVIYDHVILVLKGVSLQVPEEGIVALLGANGAGKSTTLKAISGLLRTERGEVTKGSIELRGEALKRAKTMDAAGVKAALETIKDFDTGGLSAPITFTPTDHRPNTKLRIMNVNKDGKIVLVKEVAVERKAEWLGK